MRRSQVRFLSAPPSFNAPKESEHAGFDIGMDRGIREWLQRNYLVWAPEDTEPSEPAEPATNAQPPAAPPQ